MEKETREQVNKLVDLDGNPCENCLVAITCRKHCKEWKTYVINNFGVTGIEFPEYKENE